MATFWKKGDRVTPISEDQYEITLARVTDGSLVLDADCTHFGFFERGPLQVQTTGQGEAMLPRGGFFRIPGKARIYGRRGFVISMKGVSGFFQLGGAFADMRAERYPPGGEQNCLIWPSGLYAPSLNYLKLTAEMGWQAEHRHPSLRLNIILSGEAKCDTSGTITKLEAGDVILLHAKEHHRFGDASAKSPLIFVAFHPDSAAEVFTHAPMPAQTIMKENI